LQIKTLLVSWGSSVRIETRLRATWVQFPAGAMVGFFSLRHRVRTCSGAHPASCPVGTRSSEDKAAWSWSWPLTST